MINQGDKACLPFFFFFPPKRCQSPSSELPPGSKSERLDCTSQQPRLEAAGQSSSYLDMCFGFVEQPERCVPGAVWS